MNTFTLNSLEASLASASLLPMVDPAQAVCIGADVSGDEHHALAEIQDPALAVFGPEYGRNLAHVRCAPFPADILPRLHK
jgi:hypothetical protein